MSLSKTFIFHVNDNRRAINIDNCLQHHDDKCGNITDKLLKFLSRNREGVSTGVGDGKLFVDDVLDPLEKHKLYSYRKLESMICLDGKELKETPSRHPLNPSRKEEV